MPSLLQLYSSLFQTSIPFLNFILTFHCCHPTQLSVWSPSPCTYAATPLYLVSTHIIQAPRPSTGPHKLRDSLPLVVLLRNRLKYALTYKEAMMILKQRQVLVDGRARTDLTFPAGFMDVVSIPKTDENFRLLYDTKVRVVLCSSVSSVCTCEKKAHLLSSSSSSKIQ